LGFRRSLHARKRLQCMSQIVYHSGLKSAEGLYPSWSQIWRIKQSWLLASVCADILYTRNCLSKRSMYMNLTRLNSTHCPTPESQHHRFSAANNNTVSVIIEYLANADTVSVVADRFFCICNCRLCFTLPESSTFHWISLHPQPTYCGSTQPLRFLSFIVSCSSFS